MRFFYSSEDSENQWVPIRSCILARIYYVFYGRNAWWGTWSSKYVDDFTLKRSEATARVERRRVQGSTWTIRELPAIAFLGKQLALIISEINTDNILQGHGYSKSCKPFLNKIADHFEPRREDSIIRLITDEIQAIQPASSFETLGNETSMGKSIPFNWYIKDAPTLRHDSLYEYMHAFFDSMYSNAFLGVDYKEENGNTVITDFLEDSPLKLHGLQVGDIIETVVTKGERIPMKEFLERARPGDRTIFNIQRNSFPKDKVYKVQSFAEIFLAPLKREKISN